MLIAQITDLHCREADSLPTHGFDNNGNVARAVSRLNGLSPRPDLVIATGDLTAKGDMAQYEALDTLLAPLEMPLYLLPGNHDVYETLVSAFDGRYGIHNDGSDFVRTVVDGGAIRLIALDTSDPGHHSGAVPSKRATWLDDRLCAAPEIPTLIFMHHPPFETGIWWMDRLGILEGLDGLAEVLGRHSQVIGMVAGHLHRTIHSTFAGIPVTVCTSTCYAVDLDIRDEAAGKFTNEPPGFMLHRWSGSTLVSHSLFLDDHEIHEVMPNKKKWQARLERMRLRQPVPKFMGSIE